MLGFEAFLNDDWTISPGKLLPVSRLGGITYARVNQGFEVPRPSWSAEKDKSAVQEALAQKAKQ